MSIPVGKLVEAITSLNICSKVVEIEKTSECRLLYCKDDVSTVIAVAGFEDWVYIKVVPEEGLPAHMWHCDQVYYTPYGVYVFAKTVEDLVEKLSKKLDMVKAIARLAAERAAAMGLE